MPLVLLTGGVRSGKSRAAVGYAESLEEVVFIATAEALDGEMATRIKDHRAQRPTSWTLVEEPLDIAKPLADAAPDACVIVDCLTLWVSNLMLDDRSSEDIEAAAAAAAEIAAARPGPTIVVTNEVGSGVHANTDLGRRYADELGRVNVIWSLAADEAYLVVAGRKLRLE